MNTTTPSSRWPTTGPDQHNAISRKMNEELHHAWQRFRDDDDAFVLVITGAGEKTFCAGWDLQDASELEELGDREDTFFGQFDRNTNAYVSARYGF
jgi:enoyl-CoA hydratase/carnithine racemase